MSLPVQQDPEQGQLVEASGTAERLECLLVALEAVIDWHREGLLPLGPVLTGDPRCRLVLGDFFGLAASREGFDPKTPERQFDAILVDIDHAPDDLLDAASASFYTPQGFAALARHLRPGGVFSWADIRAEGMMAATEAAFDHPDLELMTAQDITPGVLRALDMLSARKAERIARVPLISGFLSEFAATKGTTLYEAFAKGEATYLSRRYRRR